MDDEDRKTYLDLGDGHTLEFTRWDPDLGLNPQYAGMPVPVERFGALLYHKKPDGSLCCGGITFDGDVQRQVCPNTPRWTVESWDPLTVAPSLLCKAEGCNDHGFIRQGKWVCA